MVKVLLTTLTFCATAITVGAQQSQTEAPQIPNGDLESWTGTENSEPDNWNSFESATGSMSAFVKAKQVDKSSLTRPGSTGQSSAVIWARNAFLGIPAQGNLTLGRICAGSANAADKANHNQSITSDPEFSQKLGAMPDSIVAWVRFVPKKELTDFPYARISATIHDEYDYIEYGSADVEDAENEAHAVAHAAKNIEAAKNDAGEYVWQRISIPFLTDGCTATDPAYIIVNLTTNATPGKGTVGDSLYIDDIELIYREKEAADYTPLLEDAYTGSLLVTINEQSTPPSTENVLISKTGENTIQLSLNNFKMLNGIDEDGNPEYMFVGNIVISDIVLSSEDGKTVKIVKEDDINILPGTEPEGAMWMGPMLGPVPVSIDGTGDSERLDINIDINMPGVGVIKVTFNGKENNGAVGIECIRPTIAENAYEVYTINGVRITAGTGKANLNNLPKGVYIVKSQGKVQKVFNK